MNWGKLLRGAVKVAKVLRLDQKLKGVLTKLIDKAFKNDIDRAQKAAHKLKKSKKDWAETKEILWPGHLDEKS